MQRAKQLPCHTVSMSSYAISSFDPTPLLLQQHGVTAAQGEEQPQEEEEEEEQQQPSESRGQGRGADEKQHMRSLGQWNFAVGGERVMCCGFWDHSVKCYGVDGGFKLQSNTCGGHRGAINCLQLGEDNITLVTGT